ncbi:MAG: LysM peptidoglycan-binding domain-containing protein [Anaerolineales bacterium]
MRRFVTYFALLGFMMMLGTVSFAVAQDDTAAPTRTHTVQPGETLFSIAQRYDVTVREIVEATDGLDDPNQLAVGQTLVIPSADSADTTAQAADETGPTPRPTTTAQTHLVRDGENLYTIARRYGVEVAELAELNNISDFNRVLIGQRLRIPERTSPLAPPNNLGTGGPAPAVTPFPDNQATSVGFDFGIVAYGASSNLETLGVSWVALPIEWARYEGTEGNIDFDALDALIDPLDATGINIMLSVSDAPNWARATTQDDGPPQDPADYARFIGALAERYSDMVDAYEVWHTPNLVSNWRGGTLSAESYMALLRPAYNAIKAADPTARVISAGLAQTATNDSVTAIDNLVYLANLYEAGLADFSDGVGVQAYGWANPPDATCCRNNRPAVPAWDDQAAFFFLETLQASREIMNENDDSGTFIWVTAFGWGTEPAEDAIVNPEVGYVTYTDLAEQAQYVARGFQLGRDLTYVGPMFLDNLNACTARGAGDWPCYYSLIGPDGAPRPAFETLRQLTP